jgi:hypothetical protein
MPRPRQNSRERAGRQKQRRKAVNKITKYEAIDGRLFNCEQECKDWDSHILEVRAIIDLLAPLPEEKGCNFSNGDGYVQQKKPIVEHAIRAIVRIAKTDLGVNKKDFLENPFGYRHSIIGRYIDDGGDLHLYRAWSRFMCMDDQFREWGQPYYASHPHEGKQHEIKTGAQGKEAVAQHTTPQSFKPEDRPA